MTNVIHDIMQHHKKSIKYAKVHFSQWRKMKTKMEDANEEILANFSIGLSLDQSFMLLEILKKNSYR